MRVRRVLLVGASVLLLVAASGCDWLQPGADAGHSGYNPLEPTLAVTKLAPRFTISTAGRAYGQPIVAGHQLFAASVESSMTTARVEQFDAATGNPGWSTTLSNTAGSVTDVASDADTLYVAVNPPGSGTSTLFAISARSGAITWQVPLPAAYTAQTLTVDGGKVLVSLFTPSAASPFVANGSAEVRAVDAATGATLWTFNSGFDTATRGPVRTSVTSNGFASVTYPCCWGPPHVEFPCPATEILNEADGTVTFDAQSCVAGASGLTLASSANGLLYGDGMNGGFPFSEAFNPATNTPTWTSGDVSSLNNSVVAVNSQVAIFADTSKLLARDALTGAIQWTSAPLSNVSYESDPVIAGGIVYLATSDGTTTSLRTFNATTGAPLASLNIGTATGVQSVAAPVVSYGNVYVNETGTITAYAPT
ncbi:MAG: PQQ-binding-like beta-propeller repeat protein [Actinobacteria bacterium]|nr:PQQ-binding-like beta-propeller repeat protein [Actinomycetota bacterium]